MKDFARRWGTAAAFVAICAGFSIAAPEAFASAANVVNLLQQMTTLAIVAIAATVVMVVGEFDLSVGFTASLAAVIAFVLMADGSAVPVAVLAALAAGTAAGLASGVLVARFQVPSFVATLAVGTILSGGAYWASGGASLFSGVPESFKALGRGSFFGLPVLALWMAGIVLAAAVTLAWTRLGRRLHAIGSNREAARLAGLPVGRDIVAAFMIAGALSALAGLLLAARLGSVQHTMGEAMLLPAYAAVFLGTTTSRTGSPNVAGTLLGVAVASVVVNGLTIIGAEPFVQRMVTGVVIIAAVLVRQIGAQGR